MTNTPTQAQIEAAIMLRSSSASMVIYFRPKGNTHEERKTRMYEYNSDDIKGIIAALTAAAEVGTVKFSDVKHPKVVYALESDTNATAAEVGEFLPSVNWKDGKAYSYCPECGRVIEKAK